MNGRTPFLLRSYTNFLNITIKSKKKKKKKNQQKDNKLKSISYKVIPKTLSYFLKVSEILTWPDTESFLGGVQVQGFDVYLFFSKGESDHYQCSYETYTQQPKRATIGPPAKRHLNGACDDRISVALCFSKGSKPVFLRKVTALCFSMREGVVLTPQVPTPLSPRMNKHPRTMKQCRVSC